MSKSNWNFIIDAIMFVLMAAIAGLGLLIKYILLPGTERWIKYGRSVDLTFWGIDRHDWGRIHLILAIALVVLLALHIILHWKLTICLFQNLIKVKNVRIVSTLFLVIITIILVIFPFFIRVEVHEIDTGHDRYLLESVDIMPAVTETKIPDHKSKGESFEIDKPVQKTEEHEEHEHHNIDPSIEVKGSMTLSEIAKKYNVPVELIKTELKLPAGVSGSDQLGHLRKQYGFKMSEIEVIIYNYKNSGNHGKVN
ncbi:MAG: DUF4405 domain-containing protein [Bacteroidales bacterium]|nr:DUF4405 domain-containing protein [Bacteroidales bacterium]